MRVATWNLDARWTAKHAAFLHDQTVDVWCLTEVPPRAIAGGRIVGYLRTDLVGAVEEVNCRGSTGCDYTVSLGRAPPILRSSAVVGDRYDCDSISFVLEDYAVRKPLHACLPKNIV